MNTLPAISVIIVAMNEAHDIGDCIDSVKPWATEIIVFDSGSTDGTQEVCRTAGVRLYETDWPGDGPQKNRALAVATGDWVICLDADERVSAGLKKELLRTLPSTSSSAFSTPRLSSFYGKDIRHSGWWPDRIVRIFRRERGQFTDVRTHTRLLIDGHTGSLCEPILHKAVCDLHEMLDKVNVYSSEGAAALQARGKRASFSKAVFAGLWAFIRVYLLKRGFLDGKYGLIIALYQAEQSYYKYLKLHFLGEAGGAAQ